MKAYVTTTGVIFGLLTVAHVVRVVIEDRHLAADPVFVLLTVVSAALSIWAWIVLRRRIQSRATHQKVVHEWQIEDHLYV